jgi:hypothetical protein
MISVSTIESLLFLFSLGVEKKYPFVFFCSSIIIIISARVRFFFSFRCCCFFSRLKKINQLIVCPYVRSPFVYVLSSTFLLFFAIITTDDGYCEKTFVYADMIDVSFFFFSQNSFLDKQNNL